MRQTYLINAVVRPDAAASDVSNSLEVLTNLVYLTRHSLTDVALAVNYLDMADAQLRRLTDLLGS